MALTITQPLKGLFNIPDEEYFKSEGISKSSLDKINKSPLHYKHNLEHPMVSTPAMKLGSLVHAVILEPSEVEARYAVAPQVDKRTKAGKATYAEFLLESEGKIVVSEDDMDTACAMKDAIIQHQLASTLMCQTGDVEQAIYSIDPDLQVLKRGKIDKLCHNAKMIIDLKTTADGSPQGFQSSVFKFNYHTQVAYYMDMCKEIGVDIERFLFVVVEKTAPYAVSVHELDQEAIELGRQQYKRNLQTLVNCEMSGEWGSYSDEIIKISAPAWVK